MGVMLLWEVKIAIEREIGGGQEAMEGVAMVVMVKATRIVPGSRLRLPHRRLPGHNNRVIIKKVHHRLLHSKGGKVRMIVTIESNGEEITTTVERRVH